MTDHVPIVDLTPEQKEVRLGFFEGLRQAFRVLEDFRDLQHEGEEIDHEMSENSINQELRDVIEADVRLLVDEVADFFECWSDGEDAAGTISRCISHRGQLFPQFLRGQLEELPETQLGELQAQQAVRRPILAAADSKATQVPVQALQVQ